MNADQLFNAEIKHLEAPRSPFRELFLKQALASICLKLEECELIGKWYTDQNRKPTKRCKMKLKDRVLAGIKDNWKAGGNPKVYIENWFRINYKSCFYNKHSHSWRHRLDWAPIQSESLAKNTAAHLQRQYPSPPVQPSADIRLLRIDHTVCIKDSEENMAHQSHHKTLLFDITRHAHSRDCNIIGPSHKYEGEARELTFHPAVQKKQYQEFVISCDCAGPAFQFVWRKNPPYHGGFIGMMMHPDWERIESAKIPARNYSGQFNFKRKRCMGTFYGSADVKWDSFNFQKNANHVPSESLDSTAFISKELMAMRITEIAFCSYLRFKYWASCEFSTDTDDTKSGAFLSSIIYKGPGRREKEQKYQRERTAFMQDMAGTAFVTLADNSKHHMCFYKYFDSGLGYSGVRGSEVRATFVLSCCAHKH